MDYYTKFVGHSAMIVTSSEEMHGFLDFITGQAILIVDGAQLRAPSYRCFRDAIDNLGSAKEADNENHKDDATQTFTTEKAELILSEDVDLTRAKKLLAKRLRKIEPVFSQSEAIGVQIKRSSYDDYIRAIEEEGIARVVCYGFAAFRNGKLRGFEPTQIVTTQTVADIEQQKENIERTLDSRGIAAERGERSAV